jgi:hypothetical protein
MPNASRRKSVRAHHAPKRVKKQPTELPSLRELQEMGSKSFQRLAAQFSLDQADEHERELLLTVSAVHRKLKSLHDSRGAPGEAFLVELIELASRHPLHYYAVWDSFQEFAGRWSSRAKTMQLGAEDGQDPNDDDCTNHAKLARIEKMTIKIRPPTPTPRPN